VIKVGGALLRDAVAFGEAIADLGTLRRVARIVIVPGGGPFADAVRDADRRLGLGSDTAHWMAVLAMDQYAHLLRARIPRAILIENPRRIPVTCRAGRLPVLAPYRWLRRADPVPHSWDATSDSIAAWIAVTLGAAYLVLLKPAAGALRDIVDAQFGSVLATAQRAAPVVSVCTARTVASVVGSLSIPGA
jgi:aspartokinase-like uncharacterized kinase